MEKLDEQRLELDLAYRYEFLKTFVGFGPADVAAIRKVLAELVTLMPEIVKDQYHKLLAYDATARHFVERQRRHLKRMFVAGAVMVSEEEIDAHARREFRCAAKAAFARIETRVERAISALKETRTDDATLGLW